MSRRNTGTGTILEEMVLPALNRGGYAVLRQVDIGLRPGGGRHIVDAVIERDRRRFLLSLKWQQVSGTAEQKVPFEVICLAEAVRNGPYFGAYLVLGGSGWTLREFYTGDGLRHYLTDSAKVVILGLEDFIGRANRGAL